MKRSSAIFIPMVVSCWACTETRNIDATGIYHSLNEPEYVDLGNGQELYPGYRRRIDVTHADGRTETHQCFGSNVMSIDPERLAYGAGYCTALADTGDAYWLSFEVGRAGKFSWQVLGGTGVYEDATGGGVTTFLESLPDGSSRLKIEGTVETR